METQLEIVESEALKLTPGERAALAQRLPASLDEDVEIEEAWAAETERRIAEVESGAGGAELGFAFLAEPNPAVERTPTGVPSAANGGGAASRA